jgi:hypothetical protein
MNAGCDTFTLWHHAEAAWAAHRQAIATGETACSHLSDKPACQRGCPTCDLKCAVMAGAVAYLKRELGAMGPPTGATLN